jgi:sugar phosphate isomerase/epimerase
VGYQYLELGLYGYLPTDPGRLRDEVGKRGLTIAGGTVADFSGLHKRDEFSSILEATRQVAELTAAVGPKHVIFVQVPGPSTPNSRNGSTASRKAAKPGAPALGTATQPSSSPMPPSRRSLLTARTSTESRTA